MRRAEDLHPDGPAPEDDVEFAFDLDSDEPLHVSSLDLGVPEPFKESEPFVREDPELEWVERWRRKQSERKKR